MIRPKYEKLISLAKGAKEVPGGGVHLSTVHRWHWHGVRGVKLETLVVGGKRYTSREAIERFIRATTAAADGTPPSEPTPHRQRSIEAAERELEKAGI